MNDMSRPFEPEQPAQDDETTSNLVIMFKNLCTFANLAPKNVLELLNKLEWDDDNDIVTHIRTGF